LDTRIDLTHEIEPTLLLEMTAQSESFGIAEPAHEIHRYISFGKHDSLVNEVI
jgi:hypothetical protein